MRTLIAAAALLAMLGRAFADDGCDKFAWPLAHERTLLAAPDKPALKAGDTLPALPQSAFTLALQPAAEARFEMPPERKPRGERWFGGMVRLPAPDKAGIYQVALSEEAWIDVVQDGRYARSVGTSGRSDCPGLRKSVRFEVTATSIVLQVSGVTSEAISVVVGPSR